MILGSTVTQGFATDGSGTSVEEQLAKAAGFSVTVVSDAQWAAMTTADFRAYRVLIIGDPDCGDSVGTDTQAYQSASTWEPAVMDSGGNKVLIGTDPVFHYAGGSAPNGNVLIQNGIAYAGSVPGATGVYLDLSCTYDDSNAGPGTAVPILDGLSTHGPNGFTTVSESYYNACATSVNIVANTGPTTGLTDQDLSNWDCSVHEAFDKFPTDFTPLALAPSGSGFPISYCGTDVETRAAACGSPYILISGNGIISGGATAAEQGGASPLAEKSTTCSTSSPVNCATGTFWHTFHDVYVPGNGPALALTRTYSSAAAATDGPFGFGWTDSYDMSLSIDPTTGDATVTEANGSQVPFFPNGSGGFVAPPRVLASLTANGDGTYTYSRYADHIQFVFNGSGQLEKEIDRNGYTTTLTYSSGELSSVTDSDGRALTFTYSGSHVASVTDPAGNTWTYSYDGSGNLVGTTDPAGRAWSLSYDTNHLLLGMTNPDGGTTTNTYDSSNRVVQQVDPAGRTTTWSYNGDPNTSAGSTTTITDPLGNVTVEQYQNMQLLSLTHGSGTSAAATWTYEYDPNTLGIAKVTDPNGNVATNTYDSHGNLLTSTDALGNKTTFTYNSLDEIASKTDPLSTTTAYTYDSAGNLSSAATPLSGGGSATWSYTYGTGAQAGDVLSSTNPDGNTTTYTYDGAGDRTATTDPLGHTTNQTFDNDGRLLSRTAPNGGTTSYAYDAVGELTTTTDPLGAATTYTYNGNGERTSTTDPKGHTTTYTYDAVGEVTRVQAPGGATTTTAYDADGNVLVRTDAAGHRTSYAYDPLNRAVSSTDPSGRKTSLTYDGAGNEVTMVDPSGRRTSYTYDADNRVTGITYSDGATPGVTETYDADGRRTAMTDATGTTSFTYNTLGALTAETNGAGATVTYTYDPAGNVTAITYPNGQTVARAFNGDGQLKSVTDWLGKTTTFSYDADGNPTSEALPGSVSAASSFDAADHLTGITDTGPSGTLASWQYTRNAEGQLTGSSASGSLSGSNSYTYDVQDRLVGDNSTTYGYDAAGNPTNYGGQPQTFDASGELLSSGTPLPASPSPTPTLPAPGTTPGTTPPATTSATTTPAVPAAPAPPAAPTIAAVSTAVGAAGNVSASLTTTTRGEMVLAFVSAQSGAQHPHPRLSGTELGALAGHIRAGRRHPRPSSVRLAFASLGAGTAQGGIVGIWKAQAKRAGKVKVSVGLGSHSGQVQLTLIAFAPGVTARAGHLATGHHGPARLKLSTTVGALVLAVGHDALSSATPQPLAGSVLLAHAQSRQARAAGWVEKAVATAGSMAVGLRSPKSSAWLIDAVVVSQSAHAAGAKLRGLIVGTAGGKRTFTYNAEGDRTRISGDTGSVALSYDQANRLTSVGNSITYAYDGDGMRTSKTVNGATTAFTWDQSGTLPLLLQDGTTSYVYGPSGQPIEQITAGTATFLLADQNGSTRLLTDANGTVVGTYSYSAWGETTAHTGSATTSLQYNGEYTDAETGYQYLRARYYDPSTGQFISVDPLVGLTGTPYLYAGADPLNLADPAGLCSWYDVVCDAGSAASTVWNATTTAVSDTGTFIYDHASAISAVTGTLAVVTAPIAPLSLALGGVSLATGGIATYKDASSGNWGGVALDVAGLIPGAGAEFKGIEALDTARNLDYFSGLAEDYASWGSNPEWMGHLLEEENAAAELDLTTRAWGSLLGASSALFGTAAWLEGDLYGYTC